MALQHYQQLDRRIRKDFIAFKEAHPEIRQKRMNLSWSVWMFGTEPFAESLERLKSAGLSYVELKGDHYTEEAGLSLREVKEALAKSGMRVSGMCGLFSQENDLSSNSPYARQRAVEYIRREIAFLKSIGGSYLIVVPSAVGRPFRIDSSELIRSTKTLRLCGDDFLKNGIKAAVEPIRSSEVSLVHSVAEVEAYLKAVGHPGIAHINGDIFHMLTEEKHIGSAVLACGKRLANLHLADTNRDALGSGMMDLDTVIMASYLVGMNEEGRFLTPEPLGPKTDPYVLSNEDCDKPVMDKLVRDTVSYFREREEYVLSLED